VSRGGARPGAGRPRKSGDHVAPKGNWIYVVHEIQNPRLCRLGITTTRPQARMSGMRSLNPRALKLAAVLRVPDRDKAFEINRALKERLARFRNASGWFAADADRIVAELHEAAAACRSRARNLRRRATRGGPSEEDPVAAGRNRPPTGAFIAERDDHSASTPGQLKTRPPPSPPVLGRFPKALARASQPPHETERPGSLRARVASHRNLLPEWSRNASAICT
jgi:hypothetical protein